MLMMSLIPRRPCFGSRGRLSTHSRRRPWRGTLLQLVHVFLCFLFFSRGAGFFWASHSVLLIYQCCYAREVSALASTCECTCADVLDAVFSGDCSNMGCVKAGRCVLSDQALVSRRCVILLSIFVCALIIRFWLTMNCRLCWVPGVILHYRAQNRYCSVLGWRNRSQVPSSHQDARDGFLIMKHPLYRCDMRSCRLCSLG